MDYFGINVEVNDFNSSAWHSGKLHSPLCVEPSEVRKSPREKICHRRLKMAIKDVFDEIPKATKGHVHRHSSFCEGCEWKKPVMIAVAVLAAVGIGYYIYHKRRESK